MEHSCMEQSATRDSGLLLTSDIPEGDQVSSFSSVIRLTWRRLLRLHWSSRSWISVTRSLWVPLYTCRTDCSPCWMPPLGLSTRAGRQNTQPHCYGSFTGYTSRNESSSGCAFWRTIVCMAQHQHTGLTACGRHQRSSLVDVSALLTPRHYKCRRLVGLPSATAPSWWL